MNTETKQAPMVKIKGLGVSPGIAMGNALHLRWRGRHVFRIEVKPTEVEREIRRLHRAIQMARRQLLTIKGRIEQALGKDHGYILDTHLLMLEDSDVIGEIESMIASHRVNAEWAVKVVTDRLLSIYAEIKDDYLRERGSDIEDVASRLINALSGARSSRYRHLPKGSVLLCGDLPPSILAELDLDCAVGFATSMGGWTSHTAIIARSLGIPAVAGLHSAIHQVESHQRVIVDGTSGFLIVNPTPEVIEEYKGRWQEQERRWRVLRDRLDLPATTRDGVSITLRANVELLSELEEVTLYGARGIGLFRSEFLFMQSAPELPSEEAQFEAYRRVVEAAGEEGAVIRTVDWDENKIAASASLRSSLDHGATPIGHWRGADVTPERNPALGLRAIRFSLQAEEIFKTQLRAIARAAHYGNARIVLPLVFSVNELRRSRYLLEQVREELEQEGIVTPKHIPLGVMIEVPAAVFIADVLAAEADFISLGTNDLIQYLLAVDRDNDRVAHLYEPLHPAVLRALKQTIRAANEAGIEVEVCGEMAANPLHALVLLGLGVRTLSMRPKAIPLIKDLIRSITLQEVSEAVEAARRCASADEVRDCLAHKLAQAAPDVFAESSLNGGS